MHLSPTNSLRPVIGAFVAVRKDWEWTQWTLIFFAIFSWLTVLPTRETYKKTILEHRRAKLGFPKPPSPLPSTGAKLKLLLTVTLLRPLHMLFTESIVSFLSIYIAFNFGVLFTFFAAFPYVFGSIYHFTTEQSGLVFLALGIGCLLAVPTILLCDRFLYAKQYRLAHGVGRTGVIAPEYRLYPAMLGSFGLRKSHIPYYLTSII
jgi:MFS family permease